MRQGVAGEHRERACQERHQSRSFTHAYWYAYPSLTPLTLPVPTLTIPALTVTILHPILHRITHHAAVVTSTALTPLPQHSRTPCLQRLPPMAAAAAAAIITRPCHLRSMLKALLLRANEGGEQKGAGMRGIGLRARAEEVVERVGDVLPHEG